MFAAFVGPRWLSTDVWFIPGEGASGNYADGGGACALADIIIARTGIREESMQAFVRSRIFLGGWGAA